MCGRSRCYSDTTDRFLRSRLGYNCFVQRRFRAATKRSGGTSSGRFAVCVDNHGYEASLERNKIYIVLPDKDAERDGDLRVIDESGEDYLFHKDHFVFVDFPKDVKKKILAAAKTN